MTDQPKVIVVAEQEVFDLLNTSGVQWDLQNRAESVTQMWEDLSGGRLDPASAALVFSDSLYGQPGELEATIATMAPHAAVFVVLWNSEDAEDLVERVRAYAKESGMDSAAPFHILDPSSGIVLLSEMYEVLGATGMVTFPAEWPVGIEDPIILQQPDPAFAPQNIAPPAPVVYAPQVAPSYSAPVGVVASNDPLSRPPLPGQTTIAVTSSKGGSGKSTTALMLAGQIALSSKAAGNPLKVVLIDMDTRDGQVASLIGRYVPTALNIRVAPEWNEKTILQNLVHDPKLGIDALLAPVRPRTADDVGPDFYRHVVRMLQRTHDVIIMDTSVNYLDSLISTVCLPESTVILFVTTLATTSVQGMARALREITEPVEGGGMGISRKKIGIVVNCAVTDVGMEKDQVLQAALKVPIVGSIPLATRDVLTATNYNRMHLLLKHPLLGPAYYRLASVCIKGKKLDKLIEDGEQPSGSSVAPGPVMTPPPTPTPTPLQGQAPVEVEKKSGRFSRKGR